MITSKLQIDHMHGVCFACKRKYEIFSLDPGTRLCTNPECVRRKWRQDFHDRLLSILPEWNTALDPERLPAIRYNAQHADLDIFARWADQEKDFPNEIESRTSTYTAGSVQDLLPYRRDYLREHGWRCGNALCYRSKRLQAWVDHDNVFVLDLSTYNWSRTLKDPRMWAAVNLAIENKIKHLAAWTAGNAGLSMAMLVRSANQFLNPKERLIAYALYSEHDETMRADAATMLACWECETLRVPPPHNCIFSPDRIKQKVKAVANAPEGIWEPKSYVDLTDGWDAVGSIMYRLLFAQVIYYLQPTHILLPLGTGNLFIGAFMAAADCNKPEVAIIGVQPFGDNLTDQIERHSIGTIASTAPDIANENDGQVPEAPKIATTYSALLPCIGHAIDSNPRVSIHTISRSEQDDAAQVLSDARYASRRIRSEPSAVIPFAALPGVLTNQLTRRDGARMLVVNSGFGLLGKQERSFVERFWR